MTSDHSDDEDSPSSGPVVLPRAPDKNEVLYTWQDGDRTRHAWLQTDLALQPSSENTSEDAVVSRGAAESIVERRAEHTQGSTEPVFRSESGSLMTLPGGVILVLERDWAEAHVDQFFSDHGIAQDRVVEQHFVPNAYLIETEPGLAALTLANALADQEGVIISSPNWRSELVLN